MSVCVCVCVCVCVMSTFIYSVHVLDNVYLSMQSRLSAMSGQHALHIVDHMHWGIANDIMNKILNS